MTNQLSTDPRPLFASAYATAGRVMAGIGPDQMTLPTPCDSFDVAALLDHLRMVGERVAMLGRGEPAYDSYAPPPPPADGDHSRWWQEAGPAIQQAWTDSRLSDTITLPWATVSGADALAGYVNEITVHTWDLAMATGQAVGWDDEVVQAGFDAIRAVLGGEGRTAQFDAMRDQMPEQFRAMPAPFLEPVPVPADAPLIDRQVAYNGRNPGRWS